MPFIYPKVPRPDRWLEYCCSLLGVNWSLTKMKILILLYLNKEMLAADMAQIIGKPRRYITVCLGRLMRAGKVTARFLPLDTRKMYMINPENTVLIDTLQIIENRYGNRLRRKDPFARPKVKERHPAVRTFNPTKTYRRKQS